MELACHALATIIAVYQTTMWDAPALILELLLPAQLIALLVNIQVAAGISVLVVALHAQAGRSTTVITASTAAGPVLESPHCVRLAPLESTTPGAQGASMELACLVLVLTERIHWPTA